MILKKVLSTAVTLALGAGLAHAAPKIVAITSILEHPALNAVKDGVIEELGDQGYKNGEDFQILYENAQGQASIASQIARQYIGKNPDVIVAISTQSAQTVLSVNKKIPVVFSAVTDPVGAKLVKSNGTGNGIVTGVSDKMPVDQQIDIVKEILPKLKKIGVIYNPGETNSVSTVNELKEVAEKSGLEVVEAPAIKTADVQSATRSLIGKVDIIYLPTDNTVMATVESVSVVATSARIPFFSSESSGVEKGALASFGNSYHKQGIEAGKLVARILKGENPNAMPVVFMNEFDLFLNKETADKIGITLPQTLLERASKVIE